MAGLSALVPNLDFVQQGIGIKDATFPGGLAPITASRQDSLPKVAPKPPREVMIWKPPREAPKKTTKDGPAEPARKKVVWPRDLAGANTEIIDVDPQAAAGPGGAVRAPTASSSPSSSNAGAKASAL